jgi:hypothetical protein
MAGESVETDVDLLVSLVKEKGKISIEEAAKMLKVPLNTIQSWVDFLLEEEVLGIEYKFVTPYLYFNKNPVNKASVLQESDELYFEDKEVFYQKANARGLPQARIAELWQKYLNANVAQIKEHFFMKAKSRNLSEQKITDLWNKYYVYLRKTGV